MNICITGGAGYIGSVLTERLLNLGHQVTVVDTFLHGYHGILRLASHPLMKVVSRDIRHEDRDYLEGQDVVFHLAALSSIGKCEINKDRARAINRDAVAEIASVLHHDTVFIFTSSTAVYGDRLGYEMTEDTIFVDISNVYSQTKFTAEKLIRSRNNTIILRLATIYGVSPLMRPNSIVNDFVRMAVQDKVLMLYDAETTRPYMHVQDCIDGLMFAMEHASEMNGECYNLGEVNRTKREIVRRICTKIGVEIFDSAIIANRHLQNFKAGFSKIETLGFRCKRNLSDGIQELIKLYSFYRP